jgi:hypothetical protein
VAVSGGSLIQVFLPGDSRYSIKRVPYLVDVGVGVWSLLGFWGVAQNGASVDRDLWSGACSRTNCGVRRGSRCWISILQVWVLQWD